MFTMTKHYRAFCRVVALNPLQIPTHRSAARETLRELSRLPSAPFAIEPNVISFFRRHFFFLLRSGADL